MARARRSARDAPAFVLAELHPARRQEFLDYLQMAEQDEVNADRWEERGERDASAYWARMAARGYRSAANTIASLLNFDREGVITPYAVDLMRRAERNFRRGRSFKKAEEARRLAASWGAHERRQAMQR